MGWGFGVGWGWVGFSWFFFFFCKVREESGYGISHDTGWTM